MSRQPPPGGDSTLKGIAIIVGAIVLGILVLNSFPERGTSVATTSSGGDKARPTTTTTLKPGTPLSTTTSSIPLKDPKDVKVLVANGTSTAGVTVKVIAALKPACYAVAAQGVDALPKIKEEKRPGTTVYSTSGFEREAQLIAQQLQLPSAAVAAMPPESPIATRGVPTFNVLIVVAKDLADKPPEPLPGAECGTTSTTSKGTTTTRRTTTTSGSRITTTTKAITTTSQKPTTTAPG